MDNKKDDCYKALHCLYIQLEGAVANDVSYKVKAYTIELETENADLTRQVAEARDEIARLRKAHIELAKEHGALLEALFKIDE